LIASAMVHVILCDAYIYATLYSLWHIMKW
jgi:hypothetical protein